MPDANPWVDGSPLFGEDQRYRMGPLLVDDAVDYHFNYQWPDGTRTVAEQPLEWESPTYIHQRTVVGGRDGALPGQSTVAPRTIETTCLVVAPTAEIMHRHLAHIRRILGPQRLDGLRQPVVWEQYDPGSGRRLALVCSPDGLQPMRHIPMRNGPTNAYQFVLSMVANDPWRYQAGAAEFAEIGLGNPASIGGRTYPRTYPYNYGAALPAGGEMVIVNNGDLDTPAVFRLTGPADYPVVYNVTTGRTFQVLYDIPAGVTVDVDGSTGNVTPAGIRLLSRPFMLAAGSNTIRWRTQSGVYYPDALLRVEWRSRSR